jgi:hypothetical protein
MSTQAEPRDADIVAVCPRCLREMDDDVGANVECMKRECDPATPEGLTQQIMLSVMHCDEEEGEDGMCDCARFTLQRLRLAMSPAACAARAEIGR